MNIELTTLVVFVHLLALALFLVGMPAIQATQPQSGRAGQVGLALMGRVAAIAFVVVRSRQPERALPAQPQRTCRPRYEPVPELHEAHCEA
jgi:hypothetical protein